MKSTTTFRWRRAQRPARGFTLVELMVAMALGLLLLAALIALLVSTTTGRSELDKTSRQIENGRYALQVITTDIQSAGFIGTTGVQSWDRVAPAACPAAALDLAYDATGAGQLPLAVQLLDSAAPPACLDHYQTGTGILLVTRVSSQTTTTTAAATGTETYVQVSTCQSDAVPYVVGSGGGAASRCGRRTAPPSRPYARLSSASITSAAATNAARTPSQRSRWPNTSTAS